MTKDMFYKLLVAAVVAGVTITVLSAICGCQAPYRGVGDYHADDQRTTKLVNKKGKDCNECDEPCHEVKVDPRDEEIKALKAKLKELDGKYQEGYWAGVNHTDEDYRKKPLDKDLEVTHLIVGESAQKVWDESTRDFRGWCNRNAECGKVPEKPRVKTVVIKDEVEVICLEFPMGPNEPNVKRCYNAESASGA